MSTYNISVASVYDIEWHYASLDSFQSLESKVDGNSRDMDIGWLVICGKKFAERYCGISIYRT